MTGVLPRPRVLIVEDSSTQALGLQLTLDAVGFEAEVAVDGRAGLEALKAARFDVVLSDVVMPHLSGYELCRAIRADPALEHLPFLLLTNLGDIHDVVAGLECGADNFIRKPYETDQLVGRIQSVLELQGRRAIPRDERATVVTLEGRAFTITSDKLRIINFLASTFEDYTGSMRREHETQLASERQQAEVKAARAREDHARAEQEALRASEERFRAFMDNNHAVAFMKDEDGRFVYVSAPFLRHFGGAAADWLGRTDAELWPESVAQALRVHDLAVLAGGEAVELLETVPTGEGNREWMACKFPFTDARGRQFLGGVATDVTEKRRAEQEIRTLNVRLERRLERLNALRRIDQAITASLDLRVTLDLVLDQVMTRLGVDAASCLLLDPLAHDLTYATGRGFRGTGIARSRLRVGEGTACAGGVAQERRPVCIPDLSEAGASFSRAALVEGEGFVAYYAAPLIAKGEVKGVLEVFHRTRLDPDPEWLDFLTALAGQAAIAIDNATLCNELQRANTELTAAYDATIEGWARALDLRDKETEGHSRRVTELAVRLARALGIQGAELGHIRRGALLHDIGKLGVPDAVLLKPGPLTDDEWTVMRLHPKYAHEWLAPIAYLRPALEIPCGHHERWDGSGYPLGLKGEAIPLAARLFAAVDIYDALRSDRPYRAAWPEGRVLAHLESLAGTHLDPEVVAVFLRLLAGDAMPAGAGAGAPAGVSAPLTDAERLAAQRLHQEQLERITSLNSQLDAKGRELAQAQARLAALTTPDELTGLLRRRQFREALETAFSFAVRQKQALSVVLLDLDHFRDYNDAHGHAAGDGVLSAVAQMIRATNRPYDVAARYGGEKFAILLPATDAAAGRKFAERLRAAIAGHGWPLRPMTVSVGVGTLTPATLNSIEVVEDAELALHHSKQFGRDRVTHAVELAASPVWSSTPHSRKAIGDSPTPAGVDRQRTRLGVERG